MTTMFFIARFDGTRDVYAYEFAGGQVTEWTENKSDALRFYKIHRDAILRDHPDWKSEPRLVTDGDVI